MEPTLSERYELIDAKVTLDGNRAKISGARNDFAMVRVIPSGLGCEFAWSTVARIVAKGGAFKS